MKGRIHSEQHFTSSDTVKDIIIGMSDGLTVPFALAAGLTGAVASTGIVITAGLAEIAAGSVSMGLGGYLAARGDAEHYANERLREQEEMRTRLADEEKEIIGIFHSYHIAETESRPIVESLKKNSEIMVDFMMKFELGLEKPNPKRAVGSAATIAGAYAVGGFVPLMPYMLLSDGQLALSFSAGVTALALFVFGYIKGSILGTPPVRSAVQTTFIGGVAASIAYALARMFS